MPLFHPGSDYRDEGTPLGRLDRIDFVGAGVTATASAGLLTVTIPGGGGGGSITSQDEGVNVDTATSTLNFVGAGVRATGPGTGTVTVTVPGNDVDILAGRPAAAAGNEGEGFYATDVDLFYISDGSTWTTVTLDLSTGTTGTLSATRLSGTTAEFNAALSDNDFATLAGTETLTNKTISLASNTLTGTTAQFNTALSDNDFATLAGTETLTNKTLTTPTIGSFVNATHNHQAAAGGGTIDHGLALTGLTDDDHTQYALLAGRSGGQTLIGGTAASNLLVLQSTSNATRGTVDLEDLVRVMPTARTFTAAPDVIAIASTYTLDLASASMNVLRFNGTLVFEQAANVFGMANLFANTSIFKNATGEANNLGPLFAFVDSPTFRSDAATITSGGQISVSFLSAPKMDRLTSGTNTHTGHTAFHAGPSLLFLADIGANCTLGTRRGLHYLDMGTVSGTLTTQIAIDIETLSDAGTNIGIRNRSTYVMTPTVQAISAAADIIAPVAELVTVTVSAGGITLTGAAAISDGQNGQRLTVMNVDSADSLTMTDGNNIQLAGGGSVVLGPNGESITFIFSSTVNDWVEVSRNTTI